MRKLFSWILELVKIKIVWEVSAKSLLALIPLAAMVCMTIVLLDQGARNFLEKLIARHVPVRGPVAGDELDHHQKPKVTAPIPQAGGVVQPSPESEQSLEPPEATATPSAISPPNLPMAPAVPLQPDTVRSTDIAETRDSTARKDPAQSTRQAKSETLHG